MHEDDVRRGLRRYEITYNERFLQNMRDKLGLAQEDESDLSLIMDTFSMLHEHHVDYTLFFRGLSNLTSKGSSPIRDLFVDRSVADDWIKRYEQRLQSETRAHDERGIPDAQGEPEVHSEELSCAAGDSGSTKRRL